MKRLSASPRWRKIRGGDRCKAEAFLRERENLCVAACSRFLQNSKSRHVWYLDGSGTSYGSGASVGCGGEISALLLHSRSTLFPVFGKNPRVPAPRFLNRFLGKVPIHALNGLQEDAERLESLMEDQGYFAAERIDYDLMSRDSAPRPEAFRAGPPGLILRPPVPGDGDRLFPLHSAYEQEEVIPKNGVFDPAVSRLNLDRILSSCRVLVAELDGQVVGKINTSAESFTRYQIGGVYVRHEYRGLGIGARMTAFFARDLLALGRGVTLFVKKRNPAARAVYRRTGFSVLEDYRITYY
jgi:GNAT superfamily N-acetyltransferase